MTSCATLACSAYDFFSYNLHGPFSDFNGERSHFHVKLNREGLFTFSCDHDLSKLIIVGHNGRVIFSGSLKQGTTKTWKANTPGVYLFKLWTARIPDKFNVKWTSKDGFEAIEYAKQQIWSSAVSNKDGSLFDKGTEVKRKNGHFQFGVNTRTDRYAKDTR